MVASALVLPPLSACPALPPFPPKTASAAPVVPTPSASAGVASGTTGYSLAPSAARDTAPCSLLASKEHPAARADDQTRTGASEA